MVVEDYFFSSKSNAIPREGEAGGLDAIVREVCLNGKPPKGIKLKAILNSDSHKAMLPDFSHARAAIISGEGSLDEKLERVNEFATFVRSAAEIRLGLITLAYTFACTYEQAYRDCIRRHYAGYRKNGAWLRKATIRARDEIARVIAKMTDMYEDDETLRTAVELGLYRFPIEEIVDASAATIHNDGSIFEGECADALRRLGFSVEQVGATGDQGADLIATKDELSYVIQCKNYSAGVGNAAVQQCFSAKIHYSCDYAVVCSNAEYTRSARELAASTGVLLISFDMLPELESLRRMVD